MKKTHHIFTALVFSLTSFMSCEKAEKDPIAPYAKQENIAPYVKIKGFQNQITTQAIAHDNFEATVSATKDRVASWELAVQLESGTTITGPVPITTVTTFPTTLSLPYTTLAGALGIPADAIKGGDCIRFLGKATDTKGREFTSENYSSDIMGEPALFQAFNFTVQVKCNPVSDTTVAGNWILQLKDDVGDGSGDGWDGAFVTFEINGNPTEYTISRQQESTATYTVNVPADATLIISYTSGTFEEEHTFSITSPDGLYGTFGPSPAPCIN